MQAPRMTELELQAHLKRAGQGWVVEEEQPVPALPGPLDVGDRYRNDWEREYASYLEQLKHLREILSWDYENVGLRIAGNTFHYPDFFIAYSGHFEFHDVKGQKREAWWIKVKACKERYPYFKYAYTKKIKGAWEVTYI